MNKNWKNAMKSAGEAAVHEAETAGADPATGHNLAGLIEAALGARGRR